MYIANNIWQNEVEASEVTKEYSTKPLPIFVSMEIYSLLLKS